jgi:hypothetical protein
MGYMTEVNTLCKLEPNTVKPEELEVGVEYIIEKKTERIFPLHIAVLLVGPDWTFYGYCVVHSAELKERKTTLTFEILSLFSPEERKIYTSRFLEAAKKTGEI